MTDNRYLDLVRNALIERRPELAEGAEIAAQTSFDDIGLDSLSVVEILISLAMEFDVDLETALEGLEPPRTVGDLAAIAADLAKGK